MVGEFKGASHISRALCSATLFAITLTLSACGGKATSDTFSLSSMPEVSGVPAAKKSQILVTEPTALKALDSEQVVIRVTPSEIQYLGQARWSDRLPKLVQSKLVEAFENTGKLGGVGRPGEGLAIDYQIVGDIRAFEIEGSGGSRAHVEISAKILNDRNGTVKAQRVFAATAPVHGAGNAAFISAIDSAFATVTADLVGWTLKSI